MHNDIAHLQAELDQRRTQVGIHAPGAVLRQECIDGEDTWLVVEADGVGGAVARLLYTKHGPYPLHCAEIDRVVFATEAEALLVEFDDEEEDIDANT